MAFMYKPQHAAPSASVRTARKMLALVPILVVALVSYAIAVFAWYQAGVVNTGNTIRTGSFTARVEMKDQAGQLLWSSDNVDANGILDYSGPIVLSKTGSMNLTISNPSASTLAFQYRVALVTDNGSLPLNEIGTADGILELNEAESYSFTIPEGTQNVTLEFRTAFRNSALPEIEVQQAPETQQANGVPNALPAAPADVSDNTSSPAGSSAPDTSRQPESQEPDAAASQAPAASEPAESSVPEDSSTPPVSSAPDESVTTSQPESEESADEAVSEEPESTASSSESQISQSESGSDA